MGKVLAAGLIGGMIGFLLGFVGPLIFAPENNIGPLAGIFFTGPLGFVIGLIVGGVMWYVERNKEEDS